MTRDEYETDVCSRRRDAEKIPYHAVGIGDWRPKVAECHANADAWVRANPRTKAIGGWVEYASFGEGTVALTAHSIVEDADGRRFDITPLYQENTSIPRYVQFVEHRGDDASFFAMKDQDHEIQCCGDKPAPKLDPGILLNER